MRRLRDMATVGFVGVLAGAFVVGVLGRLAMMLLARLNPEATGVVSDDGFEMGQFTLSGSLNLAVVGVVLGVVGSGFYLMLRGLMIGPSWFRLLSVSVGAGVVAGSMLVHSDGVDFTLLEPLALTVTLFVALPTAYVVLLSLGAEWVLARSEPVRSWWTLHPALPWVGRALLTVLFVMGVISLVDTTRQLA